MQEDYLKSQFDKLGAVLGKMLAIALQLKYENVSNASMSHLESAFTGELGLDLDFLLSLDEKDLIDELINKRSYSREHLKSLADILYYYSTSSLKIYDPLKSRKTARVSLYIYQYLVQQDSDLAFFDIASRIEELNS